MPPLSTRTKCDLVLPMDLFTNDDYKLENGLSVAVHRVAPVVREIKEYYVHHLYCNQVFGMPGVG